MTSPETFTFTRDQLTDALTRLDVRVPLAGPAAGMVNAEAMAAAIIAALTGEAVPVHYRWPVKCGDQATGITWSGNLDRVTCAACRAFPDEPAKEAGDFPVIPQGQIAAEVAADVRRLTHQRIAEVETGARWRGPAQHNWDDSR